MSSESNRILEKHESIEEAIHYLKREVESLAELGHYIKGGRGALSVPVPPTEQAKEPYLPLETFLDTTAEILCKMADRISEVREFIKESLFDKGK